jgi:hypothetical protein
LPILVSILQQLITQDKMTGCSLVSTAWKEATRVATTHVTAKVDARTWAYGLRPWLASSSSSSSAFLTSLTVTGVKPQGAHQQGNRRPLLGLTDVPQQLQRVELQGCTLAVSIPCSKPPVDVLQCITALTHITLDRCCLTECAVFDMASLPALQRLSVTDMVPDCMVKGVKALAKVLPQLQQLTHLTLLGDDSPEAVLRRLQDSTNCAVSVIMRQFAHMHAETVPMYTNMLRALSCLTGLQVLKWGLPVDAAAVHSGVVSGLQRLTRLQVEGNGTACLSDSILPSLAQLTALQHLGLKDVGGFNH